MNELGRLDTLLHLGLWLLIAALSLLARLLPLDAADGGLPGPDVLLALTIAWILRRPAHIPAVAVALVFLVEGLFVMRPPGLWALAVLVGTEILRGRQPAVREMNIFLEWMLVAAVLTGMTLAYRLVLAIVMVPEEPFDLSLVKLVFTVLAYPLVVAVLQLLLRVRKPAMGEVDELGRKL
jgi:rod shape-determining protein MreD